MIAAPRLVDVRQHRSGIGEIYEKSSSHVTYRSRSIVERALLIATACATLCTSGVTIMANFSAMT